MEPHGTPCIGISVVVRSISDLRPPQSWQLLVKEHWFYLKMRIRFLLREMTLLLGLLSAVIVHGTRCRAATIREGNPIARCRRTNRPFFGRCPWSTLIHCCSRKWLRRNSRYTPGERTVEIKGLEEPQGVYYDSKTGRLYVATGGDGKLRIYDDIADCARDPRVWRRCRQRPI